uniref:Uncharacterized LOC103467299 n=1 Tax=Poecilia reticulata TaxID=8081 RepID=A0A3P9QGU5_POERE
MSSSPVLRQQTQNKIQPKLSEGMSSLHLSKKGVENKDPGEAGRKPPFQPGGSRLPVLAKSLKLQAPLVFKESHSKWEEKPLAGKTRKKACTRPVPFNISQRRTARRTESCEPLTAPQSRTLGNQPENISFKTASKHQDSVKNSGKSLRKTVVNATRISRQPSPKLKTLAHLKNPTSTSGKMANQNVSVASDQVHLHPEVSLDLPKTSAAHPTASLTKSEFTVFNFFITTVNKENSLPHLCENFQPDHAALLSVLRNEGVGRASRPFVTPKRSKKYNYLPQRVSVKKTQQKEGTFAGPVRSVAFSPDAAALRSILQNEGVKDAMSRNSVCPPGRGTSIYTAQRVLTVGKMQHCYVNAPSLLTAKTKWTPQRVRNTKQQPMSAMVCTHIPRRVGLVIFQEASPHRAAASVFRNGIGLHAALLDTQATKGTFIHTRKPNEEDVEEMKTFLHAPPRESVIFFSTGKKLIRAPRFENQEASDQRDQVLSEQKFTTAQSDVSEPTHRRNSVIQWLHSVAMLRKRFPPLEELRLDEEVATYTSVSVPGASGFVHPRCGNPLASVLHFEESMVSI